MHMCMHYGIFHVWASDDSNSYIKSGDAKYLVTKKITTFFVAVSITFRGSFSSTSDHALIS